MAAGNINNIAEQMCNIPEAESGFVCSSVLLTIFYCVRHDFASTGLPLSLNHVGHMLSGITNGEERGRRQTGGHKRRREEEDDEEAGRFLSSVHKSNVHDSLGPIHLQIRRKAMVHVCSMCQTI